jgi:hypothetical protein
MMKMQTAPQTPPPKPHVQPIPPKKIMDCLTVSLKTHVKTPLIKKLDLHGIPVPLATLLDFLKDNPSFL